MRQLREAKTICKIEWRIWDRRECHQRWEETAFEKNYRIPISLGASKIELRPATDILDIDVGPSPICKSASLKERQQRIQPIAHLELKLASRQSMKLAGIIPLFPNIGYLTTKAWFVFAERLTPNILLGTIFIHKYVNGTLPQGRTVKQGPPKPVSILDDQDRDKLRNKKSVASTEGNGENIQMTVVSRATVPAGHKSRILVQTHRSGYYSIEMHPKLCRRRSVLVASDVMSLLTNESSYVLVANILLERMHIPGHVCIAIASDALQEMTRWKEKRNTNPQVPMV